MRNKLVLLFAGAVCGVYLGSVSPLDAAPQAQSSASASSQQSGVDQDIKLLRQDIRAKKKQLVAANLQLTADEATKFWPVYDQYTADLVKINNDKYALLKEYADSWGSMTDEQALALINRALAVEKNVAELRIKYVPIFNAVIPGKKVATFFQIERRLQAMIEVQLASQLPLVQDQQ